MVFAPKTQSLLKIRTCKETLRVGVKHESGGAGQIAAFHEMQLLQKILARVKASETTHFGGGSAHIEVHHLAETELQRRMSWQEGYLAFSGEPLSEVIEQVNRYSTMQLQVEDTKLASIAIGGRFRIGDLDGVLDALHTNFGIQAHQVNESNIRFGV